MVKLSLPQEIPADIPEEVMKQKKKRKSESLEEKDHLPLKKSKPEEDVVKEKKTKKKKKKKNKDKLNVTADEEEKATQEETSDKDSEVVKDESPFKKNFYTMSSITEERSKAEIKEFRNSNCITLYGKGRKAFKPLFTFDELGFSPEIMKVCSKFDKPSPIQAECWPIVASGRDIIGIAETGSGKTLAFGIPALAHLTYRVKEEKQSKSSKRKPMMLVIAPTRELAMQSQEVLEEAGKSCNIRSVCVYGGVPKHQQRDALSRGVEAIVATPGRLIDLMQEGCCDLSNISYLVLDEADRMLDQGFERDIRKILAETNPGRQTCLFSATWPDSVRELAHEFLNKPIKVTIGSDDLAAGTRIKQIVEVLEDRAREPRLFKLLKEHHSSKKNRILVFVLYKKEAARIESTLIRAGWNCTSIHGDKSQDARTKAVENFKSGTIPILVATDVAARGLDIPGVDFVINYSFPLTIEDYVHRIGRTGRAGKYGTAFTFFQQVDKARAGELVKVLQEANQEVPQAMQGFDLSIKRKEHKLYGAFGPKAGPMKKATKIVFDNDD